MAIALTVWCESNDSWMTAMGSEIISKECWHLPILVAGVMQKIEPAHHALQQGVEWKGRRQKLRKQITCYKNRHIGFNVGMDFDLQIEM